MKQFLTIIVALALTLSAASWTHAEPPPPSEKCDDLQNRCLHRENGICQIWKNECMSRHPTSGGGHGSKKHSGRKRHVSTDRVLVPRGTDGVRI
jgi:hypothetical protein